MSESGHTIREELLTRAAMALFEEAYVGPPDSTTTWFVDNEPMAGVIGVLQGIDASTATRAIEASSGLSLSSHVGHLRFALSLANRAARGENPYPGANWSESWRARIDDEAQWHGQLDALRLEYERFREALADGLLWKTEELLTMALAQIAHGAWHLGAIRQVLGRVVGPEGPSRER